MHSLIPLALLASASAFVIPTADQLQTFSLDLPTLKSSSLSLLNSLASKDDPQRLLQLSPHEPATWHPESYKLTLLRAGTPFMDITDTRDLGLVSASHKRKVSFPPSPAYQDTITPLLKELEMDNMRENLETFTGFYTRYYRSDYGRQSGEWLLNRVNETAYKSGAEDIDGFEVHPFLHSWGQNSVIATIPGRSEKTVVIGAHQDSVNMYLPSLLRSPGADDDGSGTVTILEAFRVLISHLAATNSTLENTLEFHWYSAEEGGLLGSQAVFSAYEKAGREVVAMLQQDMTGYVTGTLEAGKEEAVGVITDFVDEGLTEFIKKVITEYCDIPYVLTECGYACSDHASASKAGYPSSFVIESAFADSDQKIHTSDDKIEYLSFEHMREHAKLTLGLALELGSAEFGDAKEEEGLGGGEL